MKKFEIKISFIHGYGLIIPTKAKNKEAALEKAHEIIKNHGYYNCGISIIEREKVKEL